MKTVEQPSMFAQIIDKLRNKSEEELKRLYIQLSATNLEEEWKEITKEANFTDASDEDILKAIQDKRYHKHV